MITEGKPIKRNRDQHSAKDRCRAVLSVWTERRRPSEICRELGIAEGLLAHWQNRAMEGMLKALDPKGRTEKTRGPALGLRVQLLLQRKAGLQEGKLSRLAERLEKLQLKGLEAKEAGAK